ncbi:hypothetical protein BGY98DRAFT_1188657 [Russula aff. rugulosa BPL654]|nr:hypothetical protein BGY98DRAFT_1188657 [Russula aff. rugulosa BPL654]
MSTSKQTTDLSTANFTAIFDAASNEYKTLTKQDLEKHPFAAAFENSNSPESVMNIFRNQAQAFDKFCKGDDKLMAWLTPIINILFIFSDTLGEGISIPFSPAKTIFTGIGVLLGAVKDVIASYEALVKLLERIQFFLQRLHHYTSVPLTPEMTELLAKIMAQILSIVALSTKTMKESRIKTFMKRLMGKTDVEDAFERLDTLTKEENLMTAARTFEATHHVDNKVTVIEEVLQQVDGNIHGIRADVDVIKEGTRAIDGIQRHQSREKLRTWLAPPNPSVNHNTAHDTQHDGTANWFIQGPTFDEWKTNGSLLWIRGNPGCGKSILCSAIIEKIKDLRKSRSALLAYYYFDFKDATKRDVRGLLTSLLLQLIDDSDPCWDLLSQLHETCRDGSEQPSEAALAQYLNGMLDLPGQIPTYIIIDALDECPNNTGTPSAREKVLDFVEDLVQSKHSNLFICITSRPEQDINTALNPLTPPSRRVSLHEEGGQIEDINNFDLVIRVLSERAQGMFRWAYCQLDTLRRCMPSSIPKALDELPITLDDTYERILQGSQKRSFSMRVDFSNFGANEATNLVDGWRPENPEEAVHSACSSLIAIIDDQGSKIVQFSHFSVKEFLTSDRLETSDIGHLSDYYIPWNRRMRFWRGHYASERWLDHAKFENVQSEIEDDLKHLFDPKRPHLRACIWMHNVEVDYIHNLRRYFITEQPPPLPATPLFYAAFCGFSELATWLITTHSEDVNAKCYDDRAPLHVASQEGHVDVVHVLLDHGAQVNSQDCDKWMPLHYASNEGKPKVVQLLLEHGAALNAQEASNGGNSVWLASREGHLEVVRLLGDRGADVHIRNDDDMTPFQVATARDYHDVAQLLLEYGAERE